MGDKAYHSQLRVEGFVVPGSIEHNGPHVDFTLNEFESHSPKAASGHLLKVSYKGSEPPPDTFKDDSQALAAGSTAATASSTRPCCSQMRQQVRAGRTQWRSCQAGHRFCRSAYRQTLQRSGGKLIE